MWLRPQLARGPQSAHPDRLDSWKEIAGYLNRDVTTVQRWEKKERMPVHRHLHDRVGSVYAFPRELDSWLHSRKLRVDEEATELPADSGSPTGSHFDAGKSGCAFRS